MRTARLPTVDASVAMSPDASSGGMGGPQLNNFEQVTSDCYQMLLVGARGLGTGLGDPCLISRGARAGARGEGNPCPMSS